MIHAGRLTVIDTTLRGAVTSFGEGLPAVEREMIARALDRLGVDIIEIGMPYLGKSEQMVIHKLLAMDLEARMMTWNRMKVEDIQASVDVGAEHVHISVPLSDQMIEEKLGIDRKRLIYKYEEVLNYANYHNLTVSVGAEDASRADQGLVAHIFGLGIEYGVQRFRYTDTASVLNPFTAHEKIYMLINSLYEGMHLDPREFVQTISIDFHGHNDFGLGPANALGAFKAGASAVSCSLTDLEKPGDHCLLEDLIVSLEILPGVHTNIRRELFPEAMEMVKKCNICPV